MQRITVPLIVAIAALVLGTFASAMVYAAPAAQQESPTPEVTETETEVVEEPEQEATETPEFGATETPIIEEEETPVVDETPTPEEDETPTPEEEEATPTPEEEETPGLDEVEATPTPEEEVGATPEVDVTVTPVAEEEDELDVLQEDAVTPTNVITGSVLPPNFADVGDIDIDGDRTLTVVATGQASAVPDVATINLGVETIDTNLEQALEENNERVQAILDVIEELGIPEENVQTANFNISLDRPGPVFPEEAQAQAEQELQFRVSQQLTVRIEELTENLSLISDLIDQAVEAGANTVFGPNFQLDESVTLQQQARRRAVEQALVQAQDLATLTGVELAGISRISEVVGDRGPVAVEEAALDAGGGGGGPPLQPGTLSLTEQVEIVFFIR